ncbi:MAG: hypothetical protein AAGC83_12285, partial [Pseudomonadota bacterium]
MLLAATVFVSGVTALPAHSNDFEPQIRSAFEQQIEPWLSDPRVIDAIRAQNSEHSSMTSAQIDSLDQQWRSEVDNGGGPLVERVMNTDLSGFLSDKKGEAGELITEMFVMDNQGLNVGQSDVTSDYMQG